ncbi:MAG: TIGR00282 family metallophosphoesterase [Planctomycetota bacterium]|jgi:metallophosphoesterase (TIGR00282 family)
MEINILAIGDVVGKPGREMLRDHLPRLREEWSIHFCLANGENVAGGSGLTEKLVNKLFRSGVDAVTSGDHIWKRQEIASLLVTEPRLLRPHNFSNRASGSGVGLFETESGVTVGVLNLMGRLYMNPPIDCPFRTAEAALEAFRAQTPVVLVDFHAEATSEKQALAWFLNGKVTAVLGTHTHVQTADERILSRGTATITDLGMTGPHRSVIGRKVDAVLYRFLTHMYRRFDVAQGDERLCGVRLKVDAATGKALEIHRFQITREEGVQEPESTPPPEKPQP